MYICSRCEKQFRHQKMLMDHLMLEQLCAKHAVKTIESGDMTEKEVYGSHAAVIRSASTKQVKTEVKRKFQPKAKRPKRVKRF